MSKGTVETWEGRKLLGIDGQYYAAISHEELDSLIGRLMQLCELTGDREQREALKSEVKMRCRDWLDDRYKIAGYDKFHGLEKIDSGQV